MLAKVLRKPEASSGYRRDRKAMRAAAGAPLGPALLLVTVATYIASVEVRCRILVIFPQVQQLTRFL